MQCLLSPVRTLLPILLGTIALSAQCDDRYPLPMNWDRLAESTIGLSRFLDAPAGKHGHVSVDGEHFVDGSGKRLRLWGINLGGPSCFPSHDEAERFAQALARLGINCVRFHGLDSNWGRSSIDRSQGSTSELDEANLERFDYLFAQLKKRGIYGNINLNVFRIYGPKDGLPDHSDLGLGKWVTHFHPTAIELQEKYARDLLNHVNSYTGLRYADDPAVLVVELVNENSLIEGWFNWKLVGENDGSGDTWSPIPESYAGELNRQFNRWLESNRTAEQIAGFRQQAGVPETQPLPLLKPSEFADASQERFAADYEFVVSTERSFLTRMHRVIKDEIGLKSMLIGDADHNDSVNGYPHIVNNMRFDYIDGHGYWQHPSIGSVTRTRNDPMVNDPADSTVVQFARTPMVGKPFVISETNHPYPHVYACEGIPILTAYAMLQDWDGVFFHEWGDAVLDESDDAIPKNGWFKISSDPVKVAQLLAAGLMWHRGDIRPAKTLVTRQLTADKMLNSCKRRDDFWRSRPFFDSNYSRLLPLVHRTRWTLVDEIAEDDYPAPPDPGNIVADTGELIWHESDRHHGRVVIDAAHVQGLIGFQRDSRNQNHPGITHLSADVKNRFAAIVLISLDGLPVKDSQRLLLCASDRSANGDLTWQDDMQTVADWGTDAVSIRPVRGRISLWGLPEKASLKARLLGPLGEPLGKEWPVTGSNNGWHIDLGDPAAIMAMITRE